MEDCLTKMLIIKGWIDDDGRAWSKDGKYLGELIQDNYILRNTSRIEPVSRVAKVAPVSPIAPIPKIGRIGKIGKIGWVDALDKL